MTDVARLVPQKDLDRLDHYSKSVPQFVITDQAGLSQRTDALAFIQTTKKALDGARKELKRPHMDRAAEVDRMFKPWLTKAAQAETVAKAAIVKYQLKEQRKIEVEAERVRKENAERQRRAEAERQKALREASAKAEREAREADFSKDEVEEYKGLVVKDELVKVQAPVPEEVAPVFERKATSAHGSATIVKRWTFEVVARTKVPDEYLMIDKPSVMSAVRRGERNIPGLRIYQTAGVSGGR